MQVYDIANQLAKEIKESKEYVEYKRLKKEVYEDLETKAKLEEFEKTKYDVQVLAMKGEEQNKERMEKLQQMYAVLLENPKIKEYFDVEVRFNVLLADINKIIAESIEDVLKWKS